jgi:hypothetical protein
MRQVFYRGRFIFIPLAVAAFLSFISFVVMNLWNLLLPAILHVGFITFWQAMGIFILCKILFGFGKGGYRGGAPWMRHKLADRFNNMTPEEREKFKDKLRQRCGHGHGRWAERHGWDSFDAETAKTE